MIRFLSLKHLRSTTVVIISIVAIAVASILSLSYVYAKDAPTDDERQDPSAISRYDSIEEAQARVPFVIETPSLPVHSQMTGIILDSVFIQALDRDIHRLTIDYLLDTGQPVTFIVTDGPSEPTSHNVDSRESVRVGSVPGVAVTTHNLGGQSIGYVYWSDNGITYRLVSTAYSATELVEIASTTSVR